MRKALFLPALLLILPGCGAEPAEAPEPVAQTDTNKVACAAVTEVNVAKAHLDPARTGQAAQVAAQATQESIRTAAGEVRETSAAVAAAAPKPEQKLNLAMAQAWLDLSSACGELYGG
ncbi:hypothetical protein ACTI_62080 [Actinoplanes sp. OR16]|uniref:hypothetical protein n=1 Tax=Actinoplanes sp. OR16 TaxID=946334 RepID=UPI000F6DDEBA|nr:hypothetical protein [Actinoplanes sp. OR16]BBH69523.1 hypothetical protein ACTI_62080 [Actinoplanes sp. OR16]